MSHKGGQPDPSDPTLGEVEHIVGKFRKPVEGFEEKLITGRVKPGYMTDGGTEFNENTTELLDEYCRGMKN